MTEAELIHAIEAATGGMGYEAWTIGITDDPGASQGMSTATLWVGARSKRTVNARPDSLNTDSATRG